VSQPAEPPTDPKTGLLRSQGGQFHLGNRPALDGVRGIAVCYIVMAHMPVIDLKWVYGPMPGGFLSVDMFFVLSGFLITSLLCEEYFKTGRISNKKFYERRAFRLLPGLVAVLLVQILYVAIYHHSLGYSLVYDLKRVGTVILYFNNWFEVYAGNRVIPIGLGVMWTLAIEVQFYLLWPLILIRLLRTNDKRIVLGTFAGISVVSLAIEAVIFHHEQAHAGWALLYLQTEGRLCDFMMGAAAAYLLQFGWRPGKTINALGVLAVIGFTVGAFTMHQDASWLYYGGYSVSALASLLVILAVVEPGGLLYPIWSSRLAVWLGLRSYGIYLWHTFVFAAVQRHWPTASVAVLIPVCIALSLVVAALSYRFVERPFQQMRRRNRIIPDHEGPATVAGATS
jgi:peptidoglycan/LPS O-acetylase OafA/YrhL